MARLDGQIGDQKFEDEGQPLAGGLMYFYETGTSTLAPTYSDSAESVLNPNPVILTATGRVPDVFYTGQRRVVLTDANDVFIQEWDPVGQTSSIGGMEDLNDVSISNPQNGETLIYNDSNSTWENGDGGGGGGVADPALHRYWRLEFSFTVTAIGVNNIRFFTGGQGFVGAKRWMPGTEISPVGVVLSEGANDNSSAVPAVNTGTLIDGNFSNITTFGDVPGGPPYLASIVFDFGTPVSLTSFQIALTGFDDPISDLAIRYSDDDVAYTLAGEYDFTEWSVAEATYSPHLAVAIQPSVGSTDFATFDTDRLRTIPPTVGGLYWTFDLTPKSAAFTAQDGSYYFITGTDLDDFNIALPDAPNGARVGFAMANSATPGLINSNTVAATIQNESVGVAWVGRKPGTGIPSSDYYASGNAMINIEMIKVSGSWRILNSELYQYAV